MRFIIIFLIIYSSLHSQSTLNCKVSESFFEKKNFEENLSYYPLFKNLSKNYPFLNSYIKINFNNFKHYNFIEMRSYGDCSFTFFKQKSG